MAQSDTVEFVQLYIQVRDRTGNMPSALRMKLEGDQALAFAVNKLAVLWWNFEQHRRFSQDRFIAQADPRFRRCLDDYGARWRATIDDFCEEQRRKIDERRRETEEPWLPEGLEIDRELFIADGDDEGAKKINAEIEKLRAGWEQKSPEEQREQREQWNRAREDRETKEPARARTASFDPDKDSAREAMHVGERQLRSIAESGIGDPELGWESKAAEAMRWLRVSVGFDWDDIQRRWNGIPPIVVPEHVSNLHGLDDPRSLFGYLNEVRLAYLVGADLAALATCRAVTEILLRVHYNCDNTTDLTPLIKSTQNRREFSFLRNHNVTAKVKAANDILHHGKADIGHRNRSEALVREWVTSLREIIDRAPGIR